MVAYIWAGHVRLPWKPKALHHPLLILQPSAPRSHVRDSFGTLATCYRPTHGAIACTRVGGAQRHQYGSCQAISLLI